MILLAKVISYPFILVVALCLLAVYGEDDARMFIDSVGAFFDGLE